MCEGVGLHPPLLQCIHHKNLEQAMQVSGWGALCGMCAHAYTSMHKVHLSLLTIIPQVVFIPHLPTPTPQYTHRQFILLYSIPPVCYMHTNYIVYIYFMYVFHHLCPFPLPPTPTPRCMIGRGEHSCSGVGLT